MKSSRPWAKVMRHMCHCQRQQKSLSIRTCLVLCLQLILAELFHAKVLLLHLKFGSRLGLNSPSDFCPTFSQKSSKNKTPGFGRLIFEPFWSPYISAPHRPVLSSGQRPCHPWPPLSWLIGLAEPFLTVRGAESNEFLKPTPRFRGQKVMIAVQVYISFHVQGW